MLGVKNKDSELTSFRCLHISYLVPVFFLLTLNMLIPTWNVLKLLNVRLILGRCLCFLKGLMAQNPKKNRILYSGKVSLCSLYRCKSLLIKTFSWCHIVLHIIISFWKDLLTSAGKVGILILSGLRSLWLTSFWFCNL